MDIDSKEYKKNETIIFGNINVFKLCFMPNNL